MKKTIFLVAIILSGFAFNNATAQLRISVNIGTQPVWGPVGYDHVEYYYMPDIDAFYYVPRQQYIYLSSGRWIFSSSLPPRYRNYNVYTGYKVVVNEPTPYYNVNSYRRRYSGYKNNHSQQIIRNSQEPKYFENQNHPQHNKWNGNRGENKVDNRGDNRGNQNGERKNNGRKGHGE
jgi:hypothetical protein